MENPLVETLEDAVRTLIHSEIEYLYLPEYNKLIKVAINEKQQYFNSVAGRMIRSYPVEK